ncbi:MAG: helix-turn-helix domain-containing protein [Candidatus Izemoplasmatales bacterium]|nr:helix-turn-helix domain-containing protein [Candidatus Izemoplasmatales bacterium]
MSDPICPKFEHAAQLLGKRWVGLIVNQLLDRPKRFSELESEIHVSGKMLSERLKELEQEGVIQRNVYPETPVKIEYELTDKGRSLAPVMASIAGWADTWVRFS